jgi:hypothetical protein
MHDDDIIDVLAGLDPVGDAPVPGSARYDSILENAMTLIDNTTNDNTHDSPAAALDTAQVRSADDTVSSIDTRGSGRRRTLWLGAAAAVLAVTATGTLVLRPDATQSAEAAVLSAAEELADVTSLRATLITEFVDSADGQYEVATGEFADGDVRITDTTMNADGTPAGPSTSFVVLDSTLYEKGPDGAVTSTPIAPGDGLAPFAESSAAVVEAALVGAEITEDATESVDGVEARHIRMTMTDASRDSLAELTPGELAWFELEYSYDIETIEVWVGDGLVRRILVTGSSETTDITYSDFNDDITITAPAG